MEDGQVLEHVRRRVPGIDAGASVTPVPGGLMNLVWRVQHADRSVIVKHAPPFIASAPEIPLSPKRIAIEATCLTLLGQGGQLDVVSSVQVRPPRCLDFDADRHVLIMEDLGDYPDIGTRLLIEDVTLRSASDLGHFIGTLHATSSQIPQLAEQVDNTTVQETRLAVQYEQIGQLAEKGRLNNTEALEREAVALGHRFLEPGRCLIQGDLWPASVMPTPGGLRIIDWEFAHFGHPAQDVAHFVAHLWMHSHNGASQGDAYTTAFLEAYRKAIDPRFQTLWDVDMEWALGVHFGCEILVRTVGGFQAGYLYDGRTISDLSMIEAVHFAAEHIRNPHLSPIFSILKK